MLAENRRSLVDSVTEYTNRLTSLLKSYYPQALELAGCLNTKMACDFLSNWPTVELLKTADPSQLREFYRKHGSVRKEVIENRLKIVSRIQPLTTDEAIVEASQMMASAVVGQLRCLNTAIQECDGRIAEIFARRLQVQERLTQQIAQTLFDELKPVGVMELAVQTAVLVDEPRAFHIEAAILRDVHEAPLAPPSDGIEAIARFADTQRRL